MDKLLEQIVIDYRLRLLASRQLHCRRAYDAYLAQTWAEAAMADRIHSGRGKSCS